MCTPEYTKISVVCICNAMGWLSWKSTMGSTGNISNDFLDCLYITILNYLLMFLHTIHDYVEDRDKDQININLFSYCLISSVTD